MTIEKLIAWEKAAKQRVDDEVRREIAALFPLGSRWEVRKGSRWFPCTVKSNSHPTDPYLITVTLDPTNSNPGGVTVLRAGLTDTYRPLTPDS